MNVRKWRIAILVAVAVAALAPETSQAQLFGRRGFGAGVGYGGYGSGWGSGTPGYYGWNNGLGYGYGGYGTYGNRYGYPGYSNTYSSTGFVNQPMYSGTTSTYQSFYPPSGTAGVAGQSYDPCCCSGSGTTQMASSGQGGGTLVVNVPENAQLYWNGTTPMVGTGTSRRFTMQATGAPQRIEARWTGPDGKTVTETREVVGRANDSVTVDFTSNGINGANSTNGINNAGGINGTSGGNGTSGTSGTNNTNGINDGRNNTTTPANPSPNTGRPNDGRPN